MRKDKRGINWSMIGYYALAIVAIVIILVFMIDVKEAGASAIGFVKNQLRFGK